MYSIRSSLRNGCTNESSKWMNTKKNCNRKNCQIVLWNIVHRCGHVWRVIHASLVRRRRSDCWRVVRQATDNVCANANDEHCAYANEQRKNLLVSVCVCARALNNNSTVATSMWNDQMWVSVLVPVHRLYTWNTQSNEGGATNRDVYMLFLFVCCWCLPKRIHSRCVWACVSVLAPPSM